MLALQMARLKAEVGELHLALLPLGPEVLRAHSIPGEATLLPPLVPQPQPPISAGIRCHQRGTKRCSPTARPRAATRGFNQCVETQVRGIPPFLPRCFSVFGIVFPRSSEPLA